MTDHVLDRAHLAEAVGNDIADMALFWMLRKFQFLEPAREQFEIIVDPWLSYRTEPSQNEIMAYNMAFTDWLLFERPYRHGKTLLELYVDEPPASLSPASLKRLEQVMTPRSTVTAISGCGSICSEPSRMVALINNVERSADAISSSSLTINLNICPLSPSPAGLLQTHRLTEGRGDVGDGICCSPTPATPGKYLDL